MGWRGILGFEYGIIQGPLGPDISGPELVAAVANAGAIGTLRVPDWEAPDYVRELIRKTRALTDKPFGIGVVLAFPYKENIKVILEEKIAILLVSWGEYSKELVSEAHDAGVKVIHQVGCVEDARKAIDAGVDAIIVQSREAGGHVLGQEGLITLIPRIVDLAANQNIPVIAAGGIVDARGYVAVLSLGAHGVCLGTRFVATIESFAHPLYKGKLVEYEKTEYTNVFGRSRWPNAPQRVLETPFFNDWRHLADNENEENQPVIGHSTIHGKYVDNIFRIHLKSQVFKRCREAESGISSLVCGTGKSWSPRQTSLRVFQSIFSIKEIRRLSGTVPNATTTGDIESMVMYAGAGVVLIKEILPAAEVVKRLVVEAQQLITKISLVIE